MRPIGVTGHSRLHQRAAHDGRDFIDQRVVHAAIRYVHDMMAVGFEQTDFRRSEPTADCQARTVAKAFDSPENTGKGVLKVEGRMVERLHLTEARRLIAVAEAIEAREQEV